MQIIAGHNILELLQCFSTAPIRHKSRLDI